MSNLEKIFYSTIGFDKVLNDAWAKATTGYPFYNIKKVGDNKYALEMALAGFTMDDIEITLDKNNLIIRSVAKESAEKAEYLYRGFALRDFARSFTLNDHMEVRNAEFINGVLKVFLELVIPEEKKPKKIQINVPQPDSKTTGPHYLTEDSTL